MKIKVLKYISQYVPFWAFFIYCGFAFITVLTVSPEGKIYVLSLMVNFLFFFSAFVIICNSKQQDVLNSIHKNLKIITWIQIGIAVVQISIPECLPAFIQPIGYGVLDWYRASGLFRDPTYFAFFLVTCLIWNVCLNKKKKVFTLGNFFILIGIFLSGSLTVIVGLVGVLFILQITLDQKNKWPMFLFWIILLFIVIVVGINSNESAKNYVSYKLQRFQPEFLGKPQYSARLFHLSLGRKMFKDKPFFGHGYGAFEFKAQHYFPKWFFSSNYYLDKVKEKHGQIVSHVLLATVMAEMGLLGLILLTLFFMGVAISLFKRYCRFKDNISLLFILILFLFYVRTLFYGFRLSDGFILLHFALAISYIFYVGEELKCNEKIPPW